ncbi:hypothetical protein ACEPPN_008581 [Leptodophora sp. 'Broadleaf-Isolate-01']
MEGLDLSVLCQDVSFAISINAQRLHSRYYELEYDTRGHTSSWTVTNNTSPGSQTQKGINSFALSANRQRPLAGTLNAAIFNTWRRFSNQVLYFAPPMIIAYVTMQWAIERNEYLNSKPGRAEFGEEE